MFNYRVKHDFHGFTIRKMNWKILMWNPNFSEIMTFVKKQVRNSFEMEIKFKVMAIYKKYIHKLKERNDREEILTVLSIYNDKQVLMTADPELDLAKP